MGWLRMNCNMQVTPLHSWQASPKGKILSVYPPGSPHLLCKVLMSQYAGRSRVSKRLQLASTAHW